MMIILYFTIAIQKIRQRARKSLYHAIYVIIVYYRCYNDNENTCIRYVNNIRIRSRYKFRITLCAGVSRIANELTHTHTHTIVHVYEHKTIRIIHRGNP